MLGIDIMALITSDISHLKNVPILCYSLFLCVSMKVLGCALLSAAILLSKDVDAFSFHYSLPTKHMSLVGHTLPFSKASVVRALHIKVGGIAMKAEGGTGLKFVTDDGAAIAYDFLPAGKPTVMYLPSLNQTRHGSKASALQTWCKRNKQGFFSADFYGCGRSDGLYQDGTISRWMSDTVALIDKVIQGPVLLVGAGVGGWVMMHVALQRPKLVKGLVGIAADPDFTADVVLPELDEATKRKIRETGMADIVWGLNKYTLSQKLIDDSMNRLLLHGGPKSVPIKCPVRLIQGLGDEEIPPNRALKISEVLETEDLVITYVKHGDHMLDEEEDFSLMRNDVADLCSKAYEFDLSSPSSG